MPSMLFHLAAVERLTLDGRKLVPDVARALSEDVVYARLGAALPILPAFGGMRGRLASFRHRPPTAFARLLHAGAPGSLAFKMAELVSNGALVGREAGLAFVAGYVAHVCIDRAMEPVLAALVRRGRAHGESELDARERLAWAQTVWLHRDLYGQDVLGTAGLRPRLQLVKRPGLPRGVGKGLFELLRVSCQATFGEVPSQAEVDDWVRGAWAYALLLSGPWGRLRAFRSALAHPRDVVFRGPEVDVPAALEVALGDVRQALEEVARVVSAGRFTPRSKLQFLAALPDAPVVPCAG